MDSRAATPVASRGSAIVFVVVWIHGLSPYSKLTAASAVPERVTGIEPANLLLGKETLYQLSYARVNREASPAGFEPAAYRLGNGRSFLSSCGERVRVTEEIRTPVSRATILGPNR